MDGGSTTVKREVPFFKPDLGEGEIAEVVAVLRSGWLTTGPRVKQFEREFADAVRAPHALALNSATAALHVAIEALGIQPGDGVLVPTMTFAATAEVLHYMGAHPVLVDCDPATLNMDLAGAEEAIERWARPASAKQGSRPSRIVGIMPVHVGGLMIDIDAVRALAASAQSVDRRGRRARLSGRLATRRRRAVGVLRRRNRHRHRVLVLRQQDHHHG